MTELLKEDIERQLSTRTQLFRLRAAHRSIAEMDDDLKDWIDAQFKKTNDMIEKWHDRIDAMIQDRADRIDAGIRQETHGAPADAPPDDEALALARAIERIADLQSHAHLKAADLTFGDSLVRDDPSSRPLVEAARKKLADLKAEKERAVLDLAKLLAAWRRTP